MTFTDALRERVRKQLRACPTCNETGGSLRQVAREAGLSPSTLTRFISSGKQIQSSAVDALVTWCEKREAADALVVRAWRCTNCGACRIENNAPLEGWRWNGKASALGASLRPHPPTGRAFPGRDDRVKHTSHRPGKYPDCPLCMAMKRANEGDKAAADLLSAALRQSLGPRWDRRGQEEID